MTAAQPSPPSRDDWRAALSTWTDPSGGSPDGELPGPLSEELMVALDAFLDVDDNSDPASEYEVTSIVRAIRRADAERALRESRRPWRWLAAAVVLLGCGLTGLWLWSTTGDSSPDGTETQLALATDLPILELRTGTLRSGAAPSKRLRAGTTLVFIHAPDALDHDGEFAIEVSDGRRVVLREATPEAGGHFTATIHTGDSVEGTVSLRLITKQDRQILGEWQLEREPIALDAPPH